MSLVLARINKIHDGRLSITMEDSVDPEITYSFLMPADETPLGAKKRLEDAIKLAKDETTANNTLKDTFKTELEKVDPALVIGG